ncbi:MAG TPA: hypothetical protein VK988_03640, partial [Acidimicrobiales bacterium]|nr:hypothetical protein [Acidimicrobiales bacterium]
MPRSHLVLEDNYREKICMRKNHQKRMVFGATTVAAFLALVSTAFACVTFWGQLNVTSGGGTSTAVGSTLHPDSKNQEFCAPPTLGDPPAQARPGSRDSINVRVGPTVDCLENRAAFPNITENALDDGTYSVRIQGGDSFRPHDTVPGGYFRIANVQTGTNPDGSPILSRKPQCWDTPTATNNVIELGRMNVSTQGTGQGNFRVPKQVTDNIGPTNTGAVCVRELV